MFARNAFWHVLLSILSSLFATACFTPTVRNIADRSEFIQAQSLSHALVHAFNDAVPRAETMSITGTPAQLAHTPPLNPGSANFAQVSRFHESISETWTQIDTTDLSNVEIDYLIVIDNSSSMCAEQALMAQNFSSFLDRVRAYNWRVAVITTDVAHFGQLRGLLSKGDLPTPAEELALFTQMIQTGCTGSGNERPLAAIIAALQQNPNNWRRANSFVRGLIVSDEDECSNGNLVAPCSAATDSADAVLDVATQVMGGSRENLTFYGIYWIPGTPQQTAYNQANILHDAVTRSGGIARHISEADYGAVLGAIADHSVDLFENFPLTHTPNAGTIVVRDDGTIVPASDYIIDNGRIQFLPHAVPDSGSVITVTYEVGSVALTSLTLPNDVIPGSLTVSDIHGPVSSGWTYQASTRTIHFSPTPPVNQTYTAAYMILPDARMDHHLAQAPVSGSVVVTIGGTVWTADQYQVTNSLVHLLEVPDRLASIVIDSIPQNSVGVSYPLAATPAAGTVVTNMGTYHAASNSVVIDPALITWGAALQVSYSIRTGDSRDFDVYHPVEPGTLHVYVNGQESTDFTFDGTTVHFNSMLTAISGTVSIAYVQELVIMRELRLPASVSMVIDVRVESGNFESPLSRSTWSYDATRDVVILSPSATAALAPGARIVVLHL